ncbi:hypothetical protein JR316_0004160 [Psilocybe cubensis]|uniref:Uncharacterized protein n=2 Tax=Psilocybe cubensis TaxID=181762 RepID=A0ACB8H226_PSICU|nr:hypothetical protein JR316_0004160 [Psilocybe cubensis]KAH9482065.1 hypothetical protein JR316_0004160 [Psilocybe cubensis]
MFSSKHLFSALFMLVANLSMVLGQYSISAPTLEVPIGRKFTVSWTSGNGVNDPQNLDICLNTDTEFLHLASIARNNAASGSVDVVVDDSILPGTYTLGLRFPGCSFLMAQQFNDFVVTSP